MCMTMFLRCFSIFRLGLGCQFAGVDKEPLIPIAESIMVWEVDACVSFLLAEGHR